MSAKTFARKDTIELLAKKRLELKERLPVVTGTEPPVEPFAMLDTRKMESVLMSSVRTPSWTAWTICCT